MADIFSQDTANIKTFKLGKTLIQFGSGGDKLVCQSAQFQYTQAISPIVPLNKDYKYLIVGDATGQGSLALLIGPSKDVKSFITKYSKACDAKDGNTITLMSQDACNGNSTDIKFTLRGVVINSVSSTLQRGQGADIMIANLSFWFNSLELA